MSNETKGCRFQSFSNSVCVSSVSRTGSRPRDPEESPDVSGVGKVGVDSVDLKMPWGRAPKVLEMAGLDFI